MLQRLNERIQGIVAWVIVALISITFALFGANYYLQSRHSNSQIKAKVNQQEITQHDFDLNYRRARQSISTNELTESVDKQIKQQVLQDMISHAVSAQAANHNGFVVTPEQANAAITTIPQFQDSGHFSSERYLQSLSLAMYTPETFQKEVRQGMLLNQQKFAFIGTAFATPEEISRFVKLYMQNRDYEYLHIRAANFLQQAEINLSEMKQYYKLHKDEFIAPEKVSLAYIRLSMDDIKARLHVSDEQVKHYYQTNKDNFLTPAKWKLAHILFATSTGAKPEENKAIKAKAQKVFKQLENDPKSFLEKVKTLSDDKISAMQDGVLPWITAGQSVLDEYLVQLTKPGQISPPIKTRHGYEIFKLIEFKPASVRPFSEVKEQIKQQLLTEKAQIDYAKQLEALTDLSYQNPDSLKPVAEELSLPIKLTKPFSRQGGRDALTRNKQVIDTAFSKDVLVLGNNSEPIQIDDNSVVVVRLQKHIAKKHKSFAQVQTKIRKIIKLEKAKKEARALGNNLLRMPQGSPGQNALLEDHHLVWHRVDNAARDRQTVPEVINEFAFEIPKAGDSKGVSLANGDFIIVNLYQIKEGQVNDLDQEQIASIAQQLEASYGINNYDLYIKGLVEQAKITF